MPEDIASNRWRPWGIALAAVVACVLIAVLSRTSLPLPMALALYLLVTGALLVAWHRWVTPLTRMAAIVIVALPLFFTGPALVTNRAYGPYDLLYIVEPFLAYGKDYGAKPGIHNQILLDLFMQLAPWQHQVRESLANGQWPLWNPTSFCGSVLAGGAQAAPYDPLNVIALLLPLDIATTFGVSMTFFLCALFTWACAREFGCTERAALIVTAGFTFSSAMAFNVGWPVGRTWTVMPLVLLAVRRLIRDRDLRAFVLLAIAFVLVLVFGHPETALHIVSTGGVFGLFELFAARRRWWRPTAMAIGAGVIALLLTAIFLLPFRMSLEAGTEKHLRKASQVAREWAAPPEEMWRAVRATFLPYSGGASWRGATKDWEFGTARAGSIILALALIAAVFLWRRRDVRFLTLLALFTMLASWKAPPVGKALHALPLFDITVNWRLGFVTALALSLLAGMAFDAIAGRGSSESEEPRNPSLRHARWIVLLVGVALAIPTIYFWRPQIAIGVDPRLLVAGATAELFGLIALLAALIVAPSAHPPRVAFALLLGAIIAQRLVEDGNIYPSVPRHQFYASVPLIDAIPRDPLYRVIGAENIFIPNISGMYGFEDIRGYDSMRLGRYEATFPLWCPDSVRNYRDVRDLSRPFLSFLGVRHAITRLTPDSQGEPPDGWRVIFEDRGSRLMENSRAIPRVFVPRHLRYIDHPETALAEMAQATDFADVAWIYTNAIPPHTAPNGAAQLRVRRVGTRYEIRTDSATDSRIVITESSWPGWRAYIDGRRVKMQLANHAFLSIGIPAGKHEVRVVYLPQEFVQGRAISLATVLLLAIVGFVYRRRRLARTEGWRESRPSP
ncbi:MAG: YfhO family protein [Myxococcales bacterium]|nr:YfhO family protein [Myxococcales bacterium]